MIKKKKQGNDLRVLKTKKIIKETFMQLVEEKGYSRVTVSEITEMAMINRNTFYLHYYDKEDLVDKILEENYKKYEKNIGIFILRYKTQNSNNLKAVLSNTISEVLDLLLEDIEFYRIIVMDPGLSGYLVKLKNGIKKLMSPEFNTSINQKIIYDYTFEGAFGVLTEWIKRDYASKAELIEVLTELLSFGLQFSKI